MLPEQEKRRPARDGDLDSRTNDSILMLGDDDATRHCDAFVIVVSSEAGRRRRVYLSLHSAEKALKRAQLGGGVADLVLCRLQPVSVGDWAVA